jgi:hypothetical protein
MAAKPRVHEVAADYGADSKVALRLLKEMGKFVKGPSSSIEPPVARRLRETLVKEGYASRVLPVLDAAGAIEAARLAQSLPKRMPELVDLLVGDHSPRARIPGLIAAASSDRWFFYSPSRVFAAVQQAAHVVRSLDDEDLPAPNGVAAIARATERGPSTTLIAWALSASTLSLATVTLLVPMHGDTQRAVMTQARALSIDRSGRGFPASAGSPIQSLGGLLAILPDRARRRNCHYSEGG